MNRDDLIAAMRAAAVIRPQPVDVPGLGLVYVRALTVAEVEEQAADVESQDKHRLARGAARLLCDEHGARLLDPSNPDDVALVAALPWDSLRLILPAANQVNTPKP